MTHKKRVKELIFPILFIIYMLQNPLSEYVYIFSYVDEILTLICWLVLLIKIYNTQMVIWLPKNYFQIFACILLMVIIGVLSNLIWGYQSIPYILLDIFSYSKFFVALACGVLLVNRLDSRSIKKTIVRSCKILTIVQFLLVIHEELFNPWFDYLNEYKSLRSLKLYYSNQTYFVAYSVFVLGILLLWNYKKHFNNLYIIMQVVSIFLSMRSKAWGFLVILGIIAWGTKQVKIKHPFMFVILCIPAILFVARDKIILYFFTQTHYSPRLIILQDSLTLAKQYFPLGTGFGTFCSPGAGVGGSVVYDKLGTNYSTNYIAEAINDMYWGYLLGQFGFCGTIAMTIVLIVLFRNVWIIQERGRACFLAANCFFWYILIASFGESPFFASYIIGYAFMIGALIADKR